MTGLDPRTAPISSSFGVLEDWRANAGLGWHTGDDFPAPIYTDILATHPGTLMYNQREGFDSNVGVMTITDHGHFGVLHAHQPETDDPRGFKGKAGTHVKTGDPIGRIGMTGWTTGPHTHAMVSVVKMANGWWDFSRWGGSLVSPQLYVATEYRNPAKVLGSLFFAAAYPASGIVMVVTRRYVTKAEFNLLGRIGVKSVSTADGGKLVPLIPGAPASVNAAFPNTIPEQSALLVRFG